MAQDTAAAGRLPERAVRAAGVAALGSTVAARVAARVATVRATTGRPVVILIFITDHSIEIAHRTPGTGALLPVWTSRSDSRLSWDHVNQIGRRRVYEA